MQPPSGGCVLKHVGVCVVNLKAVAATFGWLCVETHNLMGSFGGMKQPPSGGCVLKPQ